MVKDFNHDPTLADIIGSPSILFQSGVILSEGIAIGNNAQSSILAMIATISVTVLLLKPRPFLVALTQN